MSSRQASGLAASCLLALAACTATQEVSLGVDRPRLHEEPDADAPIELEPVDGSALDSEALDSGAIVGGAIGSDDAPPRDAARETPPAEAGRGTSRDGGVSTDTQTGGASATCTLNGHSPLDGFAPSTTLPNPSSRPRPDEWDGAIPQFDPPTGLSRDYEAGVPPFCCTLNTPWYCAKP